MSACWRTFQKFPTDMLQLGCYPLLCFYALNFTSLRRILLVQVPCLGSIICGQEMRVQDRIVMFWGLCVCVCVQGSCLKVAGIIVRLCTDKRASPYYTSPTETPFKCLQRKGCLCSQRTDSFSLIQCILIDLLQCIPSCSGGVDMSSGYWQSAIAHHESVGHPGKQH